MKPKDIVISVKDQNGQSMSVGLAYDAELDEFMNAFRTILVWLTWSPETISLSLPDCDRDWGYSDEG